VAQRTTLEGKKLQVHGYVTRLAHEQAEHAQYRFKIQNNPIRAGELARITALPASRPTPSRMKRKSWRTAS
jgi:hypothetical protein